MEIGNPEREFTVVPMVIPAPEEPIDKPAEKPVEETEKAD